MDADSADEERETPYPYPPSGEGVGSGEDEGSGVSVWYPYSASYAMKVTSFAGVVALAIRAERSKTPSERRAVRDISLYAAAVFTVMYSVSRPGSICNQGRLFYRKERP